MIKLYNSLTKRVEELKPLNEGLIKMYTCGPTVYYYPHIGNMRAYIFMDSLRRVLKYNGYKLDGVMNITDVGHLTSDEDDGDDKMEVSAKRENKSPYEIAKYYTDIFFNDLKSLNIDIPEHITPATQYIKQMIDFIKILEEKGYTYRISDGIYFDVKKFRGYGALSGKDLDKVGVTRVGENEEKHHPFDFALWKFVPDNHIMKWDSPWGVGCPGWHIECSAMGRDILGDRFDIHTGGIDHLPVHHENEIAQNDCAAGHKVVERWMHNEFVQVDGGKMSKSLGNIYTLKQLAEMGYSPMVFKYFCLNTYYGKKINFTFDAMKSAKASLKNMYKLLAEHKSSNAKTPKETLDKYSKEFLEAINDDLNTPLALGVLWTMLKNEPKSKDIYDLAIHFDEALGLRLADGDLDEKEPIPQEVVDIAEKRLAARKNKDWAMSDKLREELTALGYSIKDSKDGYSIEKI